MKSNLTITISSAGIKKAIAAIRTGDKRGTAPAETPAKISIINVKLL